MTKTILEDIEDILPHSKNEKKASVIIDQANEKAEKIILKATKKANQILIQSNYFHKSLKEQLRQDLRTSLEKSIEIYRQQLADMIGQSLKDFQSLLIEETKKSQQLLVKETTAKMQIINKELDDYKKAQLLEINQKVTVEVKDLAKKILNLELPLSEHEQIVFKALEKSKIEGVI